VTGDDDSENHANAMNVYSQVMTQVNLRTHAQVTALFDGFELVEPGLVFVSRWRPDPDDDTTTALYYYSGVARKP
jgi:hypothetical protein